MRRARACRACLRRAACTATTIGKRSPAQAPAALPRSTRPATSKTVTKRTTPTGVATKPHRKKKGAARAARRFRRETGEVAPRGARARAARARTARPPVPMQTQRDEEAVLQEAISDEFDPEVLLDTDETLYYHRPGVSQEVVRKLRRGAWIVQAQLDLHGMRRDEAREALAEFIRESVKRGLRCLPVIHVQGLGSLRKQPVLKGKVRAWLVQEQGV